MRELVFLQNKQALTTSLKVAEHFEKKHGDVIQSIEEIISQAQMRKNPQNKTFVRFQFLLLYNRR